MTKDEIRPSFVSLIGDGLVALLFTLGLFVLVGVTQSGEAEAVVEDNDRLEEVFLPPPPPRPKAEEPLPNEVEFDFSIPIDPSPFEISLDFLKVKVGVEKPMPTDVNFDIDAAISEYKTDGLKSLKVYERNELDTPPSLVKAYSPRPPKSLRGVEIEAIVYFRLTPEGQAVNVSVLHCNVPEAVDLVKEAIARSKFKPAMKDGERVHAWVRQRFKLRGDDNQSYDPFNVAR